MNIQNPNTHSPIKSPTTLCVGTTQVLFFKSEPLALTSGGDVFFLDTPTPAAQRLVNAFQPDAPHVRLGQAEFNFVLAQAMISQLRPMLSIGGQTNGN